MIYILYVLFLLYLLGKERKQKSPYNIFRKIIPTVYVLLVGLRGANIGMDTATYYEHYYMFGELGCDFVEPGFNVLNMACYHMGFSQIPFFIVCAGLTIYPVCLVLDKLTRREYTLMTFLFCTTTFISLCNGMRQNIACGLLFAMLIYLHYHRVNRNFSIILYLLTFLFSALFHVSVLLVLPLYLIKYIPFSKKIYMGVYLLSFTFIFINVSSYVPELELLGRDYARYAGGQDDNSASSLGFIVTSVKNFILLLLLLKADMFKKYPLFSNMYFVYIVLTNVGFNVPMVGRICMYFSWAQLLLISIVVYTKIKKRKKSFQFYLYLYFTFFTVLSLYGIVSSANKVFPYYSAWEVSDYEKYLWKDEI